LWVREAPAQKAPTPSETVPLDLASLESVRTFANAVTQRLRAILTVISRVEGAFYPGTPERAGEALAHLALGTVTPPPGRVYASLVRGEIIFPDPSELARDDGARDRLWNEGAAMVGIDQRT
jgi:hypothetical protein